MLASTVEFGDDAIVSKNLDGTITSWNRGAERIFGYFAEEVIGEPVAIAIPPERQTPSLGKTGTKLENEEDVILERIRRGNQPHRSL